MKSHCGLSRRTQSKEDSVVPKSVEAYSRLLTRQRARRRKAKAAQKVLGMMRRRTLSPKERQLIFEKTAGRCHICGGKIDGPWQADHVLAHSTGGVHAAENYLPAHTL